MIAQFAMTPSDTIMKTIKEKGCQIFRIDGKEFKITKDHLLIEKELPDNLKEGDFRYGELYIDTLRTEELEAEGYAREIMRRVQQLRKNSGLVKTDRIKLSVTADQDMVKMLEPFSDQIKEKVGAEDINISDKEPEKAYAHSSEDKIKGKSINLFFDKI